MQDQPWYERCQFEFGIRWQMFPHKNLSWKKWAFDPFGIVIWPGRRISYKDSPEGCWSDPWTRPSTYESETTSAEAAYYWASAAIRVLGLDLGGAIMYRPRFVSKQSAVKAA